MPHEGSIKETLVSSVDQSQLPQDVVSDHILHFMPYKGNSVGKK